MSVPPRPRTARQAPMVAMQYPLARPYRLSLQTVADRCGLHPDLVRRYVALGLLDAERDASGALWFASGAPLTVGRIQRLRAGLSLNYAAIGLVLDLLDRINQLEAALRRSGTVPPRAGG